MYHRKGQLVFRIMCSLTKQLRNLPISIIEGCYRCVEQLGYLSTLSLRFYDDANMKRISLPLIAYFKAYSNMIQGRRNV